MYKIYDVGGINYIEFNLYNPETKKRFKASFILKNHEKIKLIEHNKIIKITPEGIYLNTAINGVFTGWVIQ